jgi:hypothetical protein
MRRYWGAAAAVLALSAAMCRADDPAEKPADKTAERKKTAEAAWAVVEAGDFSTLETDHLLIYAPKDWDKRLKALGPQLEKVLTQAKTALGYDDKTDPLPGKALVFLFAEREQFGAFIRRVQKRRLEADLSADYAAEDDALHVVAGPKRIMSDLGQEGQAAEQLASMLLARKAGLKTLLPGWLSEGFGRATFYHAVGGPSTGADRRVAGGWAAKGAAKDIWNGTIDAEKAAALQGSLADYFAYGPGASKFTALLKGFAPEENVEKKTTEQALEAADLKWDRVDKAWKSWAISAK